MKNKSFIGIAIVIVIGFIVGAGAFAFWYAKGYSYLSNDSKACNNCHIMNEVYQDWGASSHKNFATCNDCHIPSAFVDKWASKAMAGFSHAYAFTFKDLPTNLEATQKSKRDIQNNCIRCHYSYASNAVNATTTPQHNYDKSLSCVACHQNVGHMRAF